MNSNKTILVTGAAGFIGYHLCEALLNAGHKVIGLDNINDYYDVRLKQARLAHIGSPNQFHFHKLERSYQNKIQIIELEANKNYQRLD